MIKKNTVKKCFSFINVYSLILSKKLIQISLDIIINFCSFKKLKSTNIYNSHCYYIEFIYIKMPLNYVPHSTNVSTQFWVDQTSRALAFHKAGLNVIHAENTYNQIQYNFYKSASIQNNGYTSTSTSTSSSSSAPAYQPCREMRFTRIVI
jgi:hypothetical protein